MTVKRSRFLCLTQGVQSEAMWESGGIKLHTTKNCLLLHNVIRHLRHAPGVWLDYGNTNTRVTANVIGDIQATLRGGIYLEASHEPNMLDHNVVWDVTGVEQPTSTGGTSLDGGWCIITDGSDEAVMAHNLLGRCQNAALRTRTTESRIVQTRGGASRWNRVLNNVFLASGKAIEFSHRENTAEGNLYGTSPRGLGLNWITMPEGLRLDLRAWQKYFGFDQQGSNAEISVEINLDSLEMTWSAQGHIPEVETSAPFEVDFADAGAGRTRQPGPWLHIPSSPSRLSLDPRRTGVPK